MVQEPITYFSLHFIDLGAPARRTGGAVGRLRDLEEAAGRILGRSSEAKSQNKPPKRDPAI